MWTIEQLEAKAKELAGQVEQSAANHHILLGSKMTIDGLLLEAKKVAEVVAAVDPAVAPECAKIEHVIDAVEAVN
jgi:hypothetical protein